MSYAGDVTCEDCWSALAQESDARLIDVRTAAEWAFVGVPDLASIDKQVLLVEWQSYPSMQVDTSFVEKAVGLLENSGSGPQAGVYMLCRSGVRSISAAEALTEAGYSKVFNVLGGFEGGHNENGHRGTLIGWKSDELPWKQN